MGNSEVGHNALGAGKVYAQGAKLVNAAISTGAMFEGATWTSIVDRGARGGAVHFLGLLSDGNVHSHLDHLEAMLSRAATSGCKRLYVHALLSGHHPLSAAEQPYRHGVTLVTLGSGAAQIEHIEIDRPVPFLRLPASGDMPLADLGDHLAALALDPDLPMEARPFIQVRLTREGLLPGYRAEVDRIAEGFPVRVVDVRVTVPPRAAVEIVEAEAPPLRLSERDRSVIAHRYLLELSEAETAEALDVRPGTVKSRLSRALERLREAMEVPADG